jgi:hypothetical protein
MISFRSGCAVKGLTVPSGLASLALDCALASALSPDKRAWQPWIFVQKSVPP